MRGRQGSFSREKYSPSSEKRTARPFSLVITANGVQGGLGHGFRQAAGAGGLQAGGAVVFISNVIPGAFSASRWFSAARSPKSRLSMSMFLLPFHIEHDLGQIFAFIPRGDVIVDAKLVGVGADLQLFRLAELQQPPVRAPDGRIIPSVVNGGAKASGSWSRFSARSVPSMGRKAAEASVYRPARIRSRGTVTPL